MLKFADRQCAENCEVNFMKGSPWDAGGDCGQGLRSDEAKR